MNVKRKIAFLAIGLASSLTAASAIGATLSAGNRLTISPGIPTFDANNNPLNVTVSWFGMDIYGNGRISGYEKTALSQGHMLVTFSKNGLFLPTLARILPPYP